MRKNIRSLKPTKSKRAPQLVQSNGLKEAKTVSDSNQKGNILQGSFVTNERTVTLPPCPDPVLKPNDLRHIIGSHKKAIIHTTVAESIPNGEEHNPLDCGDDENNDIDSMSLHADDDLELGNNEDLNELGRHFESTK